MIRRANENDIETIEALLMEVLNIHAQGRPDIFIPNTVKYPEEQLRTMIQDHERPIFVAVDEQDQVQGYAFCQLKMPAHSSNMTPIQTLFVDDLCVASSARGKHIGKDLLDYVKAYAKEKGCYHVTLNAWAFNEAGLGFYEHEGLKPMEYVMEYILNETEDK